MRDKILTKLAQWHTTFPWRMLMVVVILTIVLGAFAGQLGITMRTSDLLPEGDPKVIQFNRILEEFTTATNLVVVVQGDEERIKEFADMLAPRLLKLTDDSQNDKYKKEIEKLNKKIDKLRPKNKETKIAELQSRISEIKENINKTLFQRVDYKIPAEFLKNHALMLVKEDDLKNLKDVYMDPNLIALITNINNSMEKEYVGKEESISTREQEDGAVGFLDGIQNLMLKLKKSARGEKLSEKEVWASVDKLLLGEPYFLSYDKKALLVTAIPDFSLMERDLIMITAEKTQSLVDELIKDFPDVEAGLTGQIAREHDEQIYSEKSIGITTVIALIAILIFLMVSFRMWVAPVLAIINLLLGLIWAMGVAYLVVGQLNMLTATLSVLFLGLGIDFSIHVISTFTERRAIGDSIPDSMRNAFLKSGKGVVTGALTTSCAFLTLVISRAQGLKEMGLVAGIGLLSILVATFLVLPVMLVFRERRIERIREKKATKERFVQRDISFRFLGRAGEFMSRHYIFTILGSILISALLIWYALQIRWDYDYRNMEPEGLASITLMDTIFEKFDLSMEYAMVLTDSIEESYELSEKYRDKGSVAITEDISMFLPSDEQQKKRIGHINDIREKIGSAGIKNSISMDEFPLLIKEINRLKMNIMEMQDMAFIGGQDKVDNKCKEIVGDPDNPESINSLEELKKLLDSNHSFVTGKLSEFQRNFSPYFKESITRMCSTEHITMEKLPPSILDRYSNRKRNHFMVTIYPSSSIYDGEFMNRFADDLENVSDRTTGMAPLSIALVRVFGEDGRNAILLTLLIVFILLWVDFKKIRYSLMAMVPLAFGVFWMVGFMQITGIMLSMMTVMGLPLIVGIGIDDGVHIMHRWRHEGNNRIFTVFSSTGKAILLTSLTTMLAFGSLVFSVFPAWGLFGGSLFLGVAACFLTTVLILPGIFGVIERKNRK